jgi:16S rRNA G966 N2-methylase RsmD
VLDQLAGLVKRGDKGAYWAGENTMMGGYGGTGAIGIEALSRGASFVRFTDLNREPVETIKENVEHCGFKIKVNLVGGEATLGSDCHILP